tara:strand:- start:437 stop:979 length:543 start_codon:yes stop_codon:yes gene_type:complete
MRKAPSKSATKFKVGTKMIGNDGNNWIIKKNKNGVQRWVKTGNGTRKRTKRKNFQRKSVKKINGNKLTIKGKKYLTHYNGERPFLVVINLNGLLKRERAPGGDISIFKIPNGAKNDYTELVKEYKNVKKVFIGKSPPFPPVFKASSRFGTPASVIGVLDSGYDLHYLFFYDRPEFVFLDN